MLLYFGELFDKIKIWWESRATLQLISTVLVIIFASCLTISILVINEWVDIGKYNQIFKNPFIAIEVVFTLLLITELFSLIIVLPQSVSKSVGKQFELLSLIFLRDGFKEFSHLSINFNIEEAEQSLINILIYGFGAFAIFTLLGLNYKIQKRIKIPDSDYGKYQFISLKKLLAIFLFIAFTILGIMDTYTLFSTGKFINHFKTFYTILVFSDIFIILIALRYTQNYYLIFRYSTFVLATILIRVSLSIDIYYNVVIGILSIILIYILSLTLNYFYIPKKKKNYEHGKDNKNP